MTEMMSKLNIALGILETDWHNCKRLIIASHSFNKHRRQGVEWEDNSKEHQSITGRLTIVIHTIPAPLAANHFVNNSLIWGDSLDYGLDGNHQWNTLLYHPRINHPVAHNSQIAPLSEHFFFLFVLLTEQRESGISPSGLVMACCHRDTALFIGNLKQSTRSFGPVWFGAGKSGIGYYLTGAAAEEPWDAATRPQVHCRTYRKLSKGDISEMESYLSVGLHHKTIPHYYGCYKRFSTLLCSSPHLPSQPSPLPSPLNMVHTECLGAKDISEAPFDSSSIHSIWVDYQEMLTLSKVSTCINNVKSALHTVYMTYWHRWRWEPVTGSLGKAFTVCTAACV